MMQSENYVEAALPSRKEMLKGKRALAQAVEHGLLSVEDVAYIKVATDPYHDATVTHLNGIPDEYQGKSITETLPISIDLATPYGAGSGAWSARVSTFPILGSAKTVRSRMWGNSIENEAPTVGNSTVLKTLNVDTVLGTGNFSDYPAGGNLGDTLAKEISEGTVKVVGSGLEIINTSPEIYKSGLITIARIPQAACKEKHCFVVRDSGNTINAISNLTGLVSMPTTPSELATYPNYRQWEAAEGCYCVLKQYATSADSHYPGGSVVRYLDSMPTASQIDMDTSDLHIVDAPQVKFVAPAQSGLSVSTANFERQVLVTPSDSVCVMITGASEQSTFKIRQKLFLERRVNTSIVNLKPLVPFARESPSFNPLALELVSEIYSELPAGVMFKENPAGEWWDRVLSAIGKIAPLIGLIPHPIAKTIAAATPIAIDAGRQIAHAHNTHVQNAAHSQALVRARAPPPKPKVAAKAANNSKAKKTAKVTKAKPKA